MKICMFVKNSFEYDARVTREAVTLISSGHQVTVVALLAAGVTPVRETTKDGIGVVRVPRPEFGLGRLTRGVASRGRRALIERAEASGGAVDPAELRRMAAIAPPSTATPGDRDGSDLPPGGSRPAGPSTARRSLPKRLWSRVVLAMVATARLLLRLTHRSFGVPGRWVKNWVINRRMRRVGLAETADVYHSHDLNTLWVGLGCARARRAALVYDSHEFASGRSRMGRARRWWATWTERRWLRWADALIVASPPWIEMLRDLHGAIPRQAIVLRNVPPRRRAEPVDLRAMLDIDRGATIVLYQGSIQEHRGIEPAIEAMGLLDDVVLVVVGYGHHRPALEDLVGERGLQDRVHFIGPIAHDRLLDYTAGADIGLCNIVSSSISYHTSLPNKLFEYFMAGLPVIGSEGPEIARVVRETQAGVVVPATDPAAIADAVRRIEAQRERFAAAVAAAAMQYHWDGEGAALTELYRRLEA